MYYYMLKTEFFKCRPMTSKLDNNHKKYIIDA